MIETSPWYKIYQFAPPHFPFCGHMGQGWNADPIDTYSSIFYVIVSLILFKMAKKAPPILRHIAYVPMVVSVGSVLFHMSFTFVFLVADFLGIFYLNFYGINLNFARLGKVEPSKVAKLSLGGTLLWGFLMAFTYQFKFHSGLLMVPLLFVFLLSEWRCFQRERGVSYKSYGGAFVLCTLGYICMLLEGPPMRIGCLPGPLFGKVQLHTLWHLLSASSMIFVFRFYNQAPIKEALHCRYSHSGEDQESHHQLG